MDPDGAIAGAPPPIIGAEDEEFENDIEPPPPLSSLPFGSLEQLRQRPAHLAAFLLHCLLQFEPGPALCWLHAQLLLRRPHPKEGRKLFQEFGARFLERGAPLRVPVPPHVQQELERTRPELLAEEAQRRCLRELQAWQEPEVARQLEDFRAKRLMGMTPGEAELAELDALPTRDPARERQLAEALLGRLEEMHASISPDEEKSAAVVAAVCAYLRLLGVKPKGGGDAKKPRGHFFRKKLPGGRKAEEAKPKRGFSLAGAALWGRDGSDGRQSKSPENEGEREKTEGGAGGGRPSKFGDPPPGTATTAVTAMEGHGGSEPPGDATPPLDPPHNEQRNDEGGGDAERRRISPDPAVPAGGDDPPIPPPPPPPPLPPCVGPEPEPPVEAGLEAEAEPEPPSWRSMADPAALSAMGKGELRRQEVINELLVTEHTHVQMLRALLQLFYQPMLKEGFFQESELATIFPSLEDLLDVHAVFLESLKKRREESGFIIAHIGDLLLARFDGAEGRWFQKLSARFCSRQSFALEQLKAKQRRDARFCHFVAEAEAQPQCRRLQLKDIIPIEMQRLTKYPLLLHSVTACTEEAEERSRVQQAAECCREILNRVNQEVRDMENLMKLKDYQRRLDLSNLKQSSDPLLSDHRNLDITKRTLLHEGGLTWRVARDKAVEVQALLLDEVLLLLQRVEERLVLRPHSRGPAPPDGRRLLSPIVPLRSAMVRQVATDPRAFYVISSWEQGAQIYELRAASVAERKAWCLALTHAAGALRPPLAPQSRPKAVGGGTEKDSGADPHLKEAPPSDGPSPTERGELLRAAVGRVASIRQLLAIGPTEGDPEPTPGYGDGTGGGNEGPAHNGSGPAPSGPTPSLAPPIAARVEAELRGLEAALGAMKALEDDYWRLREMLRRESSST